MNSDDYDIEHLQTFLQSYPRTVVLTGAGTSLASGIPTYRDHEGRWQHSEPIKHQEFLQSSAARRRYWARSVHGWPAIRDAKPNRAHQALALMERKGQIETLITQNVDRLHQRSGSRKVVDLHGRLDQVRCLDCSALYCRQQIQQQMTTEDPPLSSPAGARRPDGDLDLPAAMEQLNRVPDCARCGGLLMPDVVFFGGTVPRARVDSCMAALERADGLIVVGSSLKVYSGFRFCRRASELGKPLAILNTGATPADVLAQCKLTSDCGALLAAVSGLSEQLTGAA